jgi:peptide/nickel transport system permease protein
MPEPRDKDPSEHEAPTEVPPMSAVESAGASGVAAGVGPSAGVMVMHSHLRKEPKGFWADAWSQVLRRNGAVMGLIWIGIVAFFAIFSPLIASGHPLILWELDEAGERIGWTSPLIRHLTSVDVLLLIGGIVVPVWLLVPAKKVDVERGLKSVVLGAALCSPLLLILAWQFIVPIGVFGMIAAAIVLIAASAALVWMLVEADTKLSDRGIKILYVVLQAGLIAFIAEQVANYVERTHVPDWVRAMERSDWFIPLASLAIAVIVSAFFLAIPSSKDFLNRLLLVIAVGALSGTIICNWWTPPDSVFDYGERKMMQEIEATYVLLPYSHYQRQMELDLLPPGSRPADSPKWLGPDGVESGASFVLGTDSSGQDVLAQLMHACRLSISIGFVSTGIAVFIGVTLGALMGYFGGWVDMLLYRVVEVFMAIPILFLLIVAAAVLPRNIYVMMAIIGCVTWTGAARFTRAEFYRLRGQDFVQAARAIGLPLRSVLFRHMLPNGVTPVLVEASFAVAAAILFETILSYLGLGPVDQASWGRLLSDAFNEVGDFIWWLAIFPGFAIFLTVLSLTLVGEALRDAIDPKLKKAAQA